MPLKLSVPVGGAVAIGGPATMRVAKKSGQVVSLVFDADRSVHIKLIPGREEPAAPSPRVAVGLGPGESDQPSPSPGLGRRT